MEVANKPDPKSAYASVEINRILSPFRHRAARVFRIVPRKDLRQQCSIAHSSRHGPDVGWWFTFHGFRAGGKGRSNDGPPMANSCNAVLPKIIARAQESAGLDPRNPCSPCCALWRPQKAALTSVLFMPPSRRPHPNARESASHPTFGSRGHPSSPGPTWQFPSAGNQQTAPAWTVPDQRQVSPACRPPRPPSAR